MNAIVDMYRSWYGNTQASLPWLEGLETEGWFSLLTVWLFSGLFIKLSLCFMSLLVN